MSINYTYKIINVDEQARCMEIVYSADGHTPQHIGARLPFEGEELEAVVRMYAPVAYWLEQKRAVVTPSVGAEGSVNAADEEAQALAALAALEAQQQQQQPVSQGAQDL
jgi:hypothetical protein